MLNYITISLVFILLAYAVILLAKNAILYMQRIKDLPKKESEFIYDLISEGKLKLDKASQMERTNNGLATNEVHTIILEKVSGLSEEEKRQLLKDLDEEQISEKRKYDRKDFVRVIDYIVGDRYYRDFIQDISEGGLFIDTSNQFSAGQKILMTFVSPDYQKPFKIHGEIIHAKTDGIGVKFKIESQVQESVLKNYVNMIQA